LVGEFTHLMDWYWIRETDQNERTDTLNTNFSIHIERRLNAGPSIVFEVIRSGDFFRYTGTSTLEQDFRPGGFFRMNFANRGEISGSFQKISPDREVLLSWNVYGFRNVDEEGTEVTISLQSVGNGTDLQLIHNGIAGRDSYEGKIRGWGGVLDSLEKNLSK